jgi:hypothetical protein
VSTRLVGQRISRFRCLTGRERPASPGGRPRRGDRSTLARRCRADHCNFSLCPPFASHESLTRCSMLGPLCSRSEVIRRALPVRVLAGRPRSVPSRAAAAGSRPTGEGTRTSSTASSRIVRMTIALRKTAVATASPNSLSTRSSPAAMGGKDGDHDRLGRRGRRVPAAPPPGGRSRSTGSAALRLLRAAARLGQS